MLDGQEVTSNVPFTSGFRKCQCTHPGYFARVPLMVFKSPSSREHFSTAISTCFASTWGSTCIAWSFMVHSLIPQVPPLRCAPVGMTNLFRYHQPGTQTNLSSRPDPDFLPRIAGHSRVCCFRYGKQHEVRQRHQAQQEIRGSAAEWRDLRCSWLVRLVERSRR